MDGTDVMYCGMAVKRMGMVRVSIRKMKVLTVKMETVTLSGKGRWNLMWFVRRMQ
jgi:hypothetical protein